LKVCKVSSWVVVVAHNVLGDPITALLPEVFTTRPLASDIGSDACFDLASYWLKICSETHGLRCTLIESMLPTRVIDVDEPDSPLCKLYCTDSEPGEWLTLSHCWGGKIPMTTTLQSLQSRRNGIIMAEMPQTFQDAVVITRKLGYRYLWIDCLCIIQDSIEDWQTESVKMAEIYSNAVLNISADASSDPYQGIFLAANGKRLESPLKGYANRPELK
jgi:Heterokaryon incompatibility protein (HET)